MGNNKATTSPATYARIAGVLYLLIISFGIFSEVFVRSSLVVAGDVATTAEHIMNSKSLFRIGFAADTIMLLCDVAIAVLFYVLFKPVSKTLALMAAVFRLTQASILGFNLLNYYAALLLLSGTAYAASFPAGQLHTLASLFLDLHSHGYDLGLVFFAFSNFILGYLIIKSNLFPHILGYGLIAAAMVYLVGSLARFLIPGFMPFIEPAYIIPLLAEIAFCLWLLIKGVKTKR